MKGSSKPISSPGRTDKFPPPLMRFLRSNAGSRSSRGRSRSSPMFMRKNKNSVAIETTQEPSSPKVTCIGQVRVRRSSKSSSTAAAGLSRSKSRRKTRKSSSSAKQHPCWWVRRILFCHGISPKFRKPKSVSSFFRKWVLFFGSGCRQIDENTDSPSRVGSNPKGPSQGKSGCNSISSGGGCGSCGAVGGGGDGKDNASRINSLLHENRENSSAGSSSPPKYALLLTRCRSAPYRSSSLACRFWGSPLNSTETEESESEPQIFPQEFEEKPSSSPNSEPRKTLETEDSESSNDENPKEEEKQEVNKIETIGKSAVHPLLLTRCKSEPARTGERLNPDAGYWRLRRFADPE